jgi:serine/threonine protein kinase
MKTPNVNVACPKCGRPIPPEAREGLCPSCALAAAALTECGCPAEGRPPPPSPEKLGAALPQFEIVRLIGQGGMASVFQARQPQLNRFVALKILQLGDEPDPVFAARFAREAQALAALSHPNIVTIHDFGQAAGFYYLVMEYVDGVSLRALLREGRLEPETALGIVPKICEALEFAHERGVVHRDIKPENILLDRSGRVKIADFGIAKMMGDSFVATSGEAGRGETSALALPPESLRLTEGQVLGTPSYMAPEQVTQPQQTDHRADIYSLGVVFYEMLTGELPVGQFPPPSVKAQLDVRLDQVVLRALEKTPQRRYQHVSEVRSEVETIAAGLPDSALFIPEPEPDPGPSTMETETPAGPKICACSVTTPEHLRTFRGRFLYIYQGKGELRLDQDTLRFRSGWQGVTIPLASIRTLARGEYPASAKPVPLHYLAVTFIEHGVSRTLLFTPAERAITSPWAANGLVTEWLLALQEALRAHTGRSLSIERLDLPPERLGVLMTKTFLLSAVGCTLGFVLVQLLLEHRLPNRLSELIWGPLTAALTLSILLLLRWWLQGDARPSHGGAAAASARWVAPARWTARVFGTLFIIMVLPFVLAEGLPSIASQPEGVQLTFVGGFLLLFGFIIGWWREGTAAVLIASGWTVVRVSESTFGSATWFELTLLVAGLYGLCWWATHGRPTRVVAATAVLLVVVLGLGRWFVPTSVFVTGTVRDVRSGRPVANAELRLPSRSAPARQSEDPPQARADGQGRFRLYVGWYAAARPLVISAPTYATLTTQLGPRALGQRKVTRDFVLDPELSGAIELTVAQDGSGTHASVQAALDEAVEAAVVRIGPGRYREPLLITKPVTLVGAGWDTTVIGPTEPAVGPTAEEAQELERRFQDANTNEERSRLRQEAQERFFMPAVRVRGAGVVRFEGLRFTQPGTAPEGSLPDSAVIEVRNSEVSLNSCAIVGSPGNGLIVREGARVSVTRTLVAAAWNSGLRVERGTQAHLLVSESDIRNCHYAGVVIGRGQSDVTIERCRISGAAWHGIRYDDASPIIADSLVFANARCGIYASGKSSAEVRGNVFWKNEMTGMACWFENRDWITNNTFASNLREGLSVLGASAPENRAEHLLAKP